MLSLQQIYDVVRNGTVDAVVRVASPAFTKDKLESEVLSFDPYSLFSHNAAILGRYNSILSITYKCARPSNIFMEFRYFQSCWNRVHDHGEGGYIPLEFDPIVDVVLCKVSGVPADSVLETLSGDAVKRLIADVATYQHEMFSLRFEQAGSLYHSLASDKFAVGPIISTPFYRALDGFVRTKDASLLSALNHLRGPFSTVSDYLSSWVRAELYFISQDPLTVLSELGGSHERLQRGQRVLEKLNELCEIYPGDTSVYEGATMPTQRFSLKLDDFRLSNIMVSLQYPFDFKKLQLLPVLDRQGIWKSYRPHRF